MMMLLRIVVPIVVPASSPTSAVAALPALSLPCRSVVPLWLRKAVSEQGVTESGLLRHAVVVPILFRGKLAGARLPLLRHQGTEIAAAASVAVIARAKWIC